MWWNISCRRNFINFNFNSWSHWWFRGENCITCLKLIFSSWSISRPTITSIFSLALKCWRYLAHIWPWTRCTFHTCQKVTFYWKSSTTILTQYRACSIKNALCFIFERSLHVPDGRQTCISKCLVVRTVLRIETKFAIFVKNQLSKSDEIKFDFSCVFSAKFN